MSEKRVEKILSETLSSFNHNYIYFSPSEHPVLKKIFQNASKKGSKNGIPDRIYFDGSYLIIFECKKLNIKEAIDDLRLYKEKIESSYEEYNKYKKFFVAFVENMYEIYNDSFEKINMKLEPISFGIINKDIIYNNENMEKDIHKIHNYIRDYTKISNEDKSFFIACILISLQKASFHKILENYNSKEYIYDLIKQNLLDFEIDISVFDFFRNDNNNIHFLSIINMVKSIYDKHPSLDLLNKFYSEFVSYNNTDGKSLGIVLTPEHIVKYMISLLDINNDDIFLDLCTGTGSFVLESLKFTPKSIIAIEYQTKLFTLLKCNMILRNVDLTKNTILKCDCFEQEFKATKSAINPPYGGSIKELDFVIKQLDSIKEEGILSAIVPCSCVSKSKLRTYIFENSLVQKIVICNNDLFYPSAGVKTCILLLKKSTCHGYKTQEIILDNFEKDGFEIKRGSGRIRTTEGIHEKTQIAITDQDESWISMQKIESDIDIVDLKLRLLEQEYHSKKLKYLRMCKDTKHIKKQTEHFKEFKISELFDILKHPHESQRLLDTDQLVYEISAKNNNNGIKDVVISDKDTFKGNKIVLVTGGNGGAGLSYYQSDDFKISSSTIVLSPKEDKLKLDIYVGTYISTELSKYRKKYSRGFPWNNSRISNDTILLPITVEGTIDYEYINILFI